MTWHCNKINCVDVVLLCNSSGRIQSNSRRHKKNISWVCARGLVASVEKEESGRNSFSCLFLLDTTGLPLGVTCEPLFFLNYLTLCRISQHLSTCHDDSFQTHPHRTFSVETFSFHNWPSLQSLGIEPPVSHTAFPLQAGILVKKTETGTRQTTRCSTPQINKHL